MYEKALYLHCHRTRLSPLTRIEFTLAYWLIARPITRTHGYFGVFWYFGIYFNFRKNKHNRPEKDVSTDFSG